MEFWVVPGDVGIIFGYNWLEKIDPFVDWKSGRMYMRSEGGLVELPSQLG